MKKIFTLAFAAITSMAAMAQETVTAYPSKDGYFRYGNSSNFSNYGVLGVSKHANATQEIGSGSWLTLIGFDLAEVKAKVDAGMEIENVVLRLTRVTGAASKVDVYAYNSEAWEENKWDTSKNLELSPANLGSASLASVELANINSTNMFNYGEKYPTKETYTEADFNRYVLNISSDELKAYVTSAVGNGAVSLHMDTDDKAETTLWASDPDSWTAKYKDITWDADQGKWVVGTEANAITRYELACRFFQKDLSKEEFDNLLKPALIVTLNKPTAIKDINADVPGDNASYNIAGQRVNGKHRGIIIRNGKKIVVK